MSEDDISLLRRYAEIHDEEAFAELVRRNMDVVYSAGLRRLGGNTHLAADVAQEVFVTLSRRAAALSRHPALHAWLHTATRNAAVNAIRSEVRRKAREQEAEMMRHTLSDNEDPAGWERVSPFLDRALDELNDTDRAGILLRYLHRRSFSDIGKTLRLTEDAARMRVDRALEKLRVGLAKRGVRSTSALLTSALLENGVTAAPANLTAAALKLALAVTPAPGWGGLGSLSSAPKLVLGVAASLIVAVAISVGLFNYKERTATERDFADEQEGIRALEKQLAQLDAEVQERQRGKARVQDQIAKARAQTTSAARVALVNASVRSGAVAGGRRTDVAAKYDLLYRKLGLAPSQIDAFEKLRIRIPDTQIWVYQDVNTPVAVPADAVSPKQGQDVERELRSLLGERDYAAYQEFNRTLPARDLAARLASAVFRTEPLSASQADEFSRIVAQSSRAYRAGLAASPNDIDWEVVNRETADLLTPSQRNALVTLQQQDAFDAAVIHKLNSGTSSASLVPVSP